MSIHDFDATAIAETLGAAGLGGAAASDVTDRLTSLANRFRNEHGTSPEDAWFVPGRVEILGKHTDYAGGRTLVCALERGLSVVGAARDDGLLRIVDVRRQSSIVLDPAASTPSLSWANYPLTVLRRLERNFPGAVRGADMMFDSSLPSASGMSSSSALMIAVLSVIVRASDLEAHPDWRAHIVSLEDVAAYAATIENGSGFRGLAGERGVGTRGGSEDHTAILCSRAGRLGQYAYRPTRFERSIPLDPAWTLAVAVSGVRAQKTGNARDAYNRAAALVSEIVERWRAATGRVDETLDQALSSAPEARERLRRLLPQPLADRFDQFVEESTVLVPAAGDQLEAGDYTSFGTTVARSQALAETQLGNQVVETATLARLARLHGAAAASAFGAGFGGSVWALVERQQSHAFLERWQNAYAAAHPEAAARATFFTSRPGPGAVHLDGCRNTRASN